MARNEYHYVITLQFRKEGVPGVNTNTVTGTVAAQRGEDRQALYQRLLKNAMQALEANNAVTLFFDLAPNDL
ncbi:hypothetical protein [Streptomyces tricolor]